MIQMSSNQSMNLMEKGKKSSLYDKNKSQGCCGRGRLTQWQET